MALSVVIPVLNEAVGIERCLRRVTALRGVDQVVVVDGGSRDDTVARARGCEGVAVLTSPRGRGAQMNAGARFARGDTLLFLHADVVLPEDAAAVVQRTLAGAGVVAGAFRTWHVAEAWAGRPRALLLHLADIRSRYTGLPYGDQAMFMSRDTFERVGGFPEIPLMEDLELAKRLRRLGRVAIAPEAVRVSGRRFESSSLYQTLLVNTFPFLYAVGVPPSVLARLYGNPR